MKITYIDHSGFGAELERACLMFDFHKGDMPAFPKGKPLYVFASHRHGDHFSPEIFKLADRGYDVTYILSNDIPDVGRYDTMLMGPGETVRMDGMRISTLRSNDEGVAFIVEAEGKTVYHAGDLHMWVWPEDTEEENEAMKRAYLEQLELIAGRSFDVAFLPLDPRQGEAMALGMEAFLEKCPCKHVFPMHMWGDFSVIAAYKAAHPSHAAIIHDITGAGQEFTTE